MPNHLYTGGITALPTGAAVAPAGLPSENTGGEAVTERDGLQLDRQLSLMGGSPPAVGDGTLADFNYENYDAADGK